MTNYFLRGLRRLFGIKKKHKRRLAPYGSIERPKMIVNHYENKKD